MAQTLVPSLSKLEKDGFILLPDAVLDGELRQLLGSINKCHPARTSRAAGIRHLLQKSAEVRSFAQSSIVSRIAKQILGESARAVRAILFDKTPATNWYVTWHQDLTIAVTEKLDLPGFGPWSSKGGVIHVQPPVSILESMISLRIHFDSCSVENGAIKFAPGSHKLGILEPTEIATWKSEREVVSCPAERGDVIAMRPLLLHSSSISESPLHRRVLHIEYGPAELPSGLHWAED